jgi:hypothetical protein
MLVVYSGSFRVRAWRTTMQDQPVSIPVAIAVIWLINFGISIWNARVVGLIWVEAKQLGGFANFLK